MKASMIKIINKIKNLKILDSTIFKIPLNNNLF